MLPIKDRERIQRLALEYRDIERRGSEWHAYKGIFAWIGGASALLVFASLVGTRAISEELGTIGGGLALMIALVCGLYYFNREKENRRSIMRAQEIREEFAKYGAGFTGSKVRINGRDVDPLSDDAYEAGRP